MIDLLLQSASSPGQDEQLEGLLSAHVAAVQASARRGDRGQVTDIERAVQADPVGSFTFDTQGNGMLRALRGTFPAGRFETPSLATLRQRALAARASSGSARVRLWALDGASPATDIGSLQATAGPGSLFQVASQFNCLESPGPDISPISHYFFDLTQGPRASISAFPGTFLRHYAAPGPDGKRFVQSDDGPQINLLEAVCSPGVARVRGGYLTEDDIANPSAFAATLQANFDEIRVGVHDDVPVVLGYNWDSAVEGDRRIGQVFTSTFAGGGYSSEGAGGAIYRAICKQLLRAAYLGTLLAAASLGRPKVVLTLIGGGVFANPIPLIWESILWAIEEAEKVAPQDMDIIVNGRNLGDHVPLMEILSAVRPRGGAVVVFNSAGAAVRR
jgi:hypothetical protein